MLSPVAHHDSVGARRGDRFPVFPLLTATLSLEPYPLADQFTLTGTARANRLELEPSGGEVSRGGGGEVHLVSVCVVSLQDGGRSGNPEHEVSDGVGDLTSTTPLHGGTVNGAHPNHTGFAPLLSDSVGVLHVGCPHTTVGIEGSPGGGLDGDGVGHVVCFVPCILQGRPLSHGR